MMDSNKVRSYSIVIFGGDKFDMGIFFPTARSFSMTIIICQALADVTANKKGDSRNLENDVLRGKRGIGKNTKEIVRSINDS